MVEGDNLWPVRKLRRGGETSLARRSEMPPRNLEEEGDDHQQILPTPNIDSSQHHIFSQVYCNNYEKENQSDLTDFC